jgi:hypothetical protein
VISTANAGGGTVIFGSLFLVLFKNISTISKEERGYMMVTGAVRLIDLTNRKSQKAVRFIQKRLEFWSRYFFWSPEVPMVQLFLSMLVRLVMLDLC